MGAHTISYEIEWKPSGSWVALADGKVTDFSDDASVALVSNGVGFGDVTESRATVAVLRTEVSASPWTRTPMRITCSVDGAPAKSFVGVVDRPTGDAEVVTFQCIGIVNDLPRRTKHLYSDPFFRRPVATKTSASSIEDPTNGAYAAGLINWILWQAGGRPNEQSGTYPTADFYYSLGQAIVAPDWSWVAGENGWEECRRLVRCAGGLIFQNEQGVIRYLTPLEMVGTPVFTFAGTLAGATDSLGVYTADSPTEDEPPDLYAETIVAQFVRRQARITQGVVEEETYQVIDAGAALAMPLEPSWPVTSIVEAVGGGLEAANIAAVLFDGRPAVLGTDYTQTVAVDAQRIVLTITNTAAQAIQVYSVRIDGTPIVKGEAGSVTVGSGQPTMHLDENIFVQNEGHATLLANMALAFYGTARRIRHITAPYDTRRTLMETVGLSSTELGLTNIPHIIVGRRGEAGEVAEYDLLDATGLPVQADYYIVSVTSYSGQTKAIAW